MMELRDTATSTATSTSTTMTPQSHIRRGQGVIAVVILLVATTMGERTTCDVPSVRPLEETWLTCYFPEDLSKSMKDVTVYHHVLGGRPEAVLGCWWRNAHLECSARQGYLFDNLITSRLAIRLPHATADQTGTYACHVTGYKNDDVKICELVWSKDVTDHSSYKGETIQSNYPILHVVDGTIIGLLVFLLLLIALLMCYLRHRIRVKEVWGRFTQVFKDKELDPLVKNQEEKENSKGDLEAPRVVVVCRSGQHVLSGWDGPAASRPESILEKSETESDEDSPEPLPEKHEACRHHPVSGLEAGTRDSHGEAPLEKKETDEISVDENHNEKSVAEQREGDGNRVDCHHGENETDTGGCDPAPEKRRTHSDFRLERNASCEDLSTTTPGQSEIHEEHPTRILETSESADSQCESLLGDSNSTDDGSESRLSEGESADGQCESLLGDSNSTDDGSESRLSEGESADGQCESLLGDSNSTDDGSESRLSKGESADSQCESMLEQGTDEDRPSSPSDEIEKVGEALEKSDSETDDEKCESSLVEKRHR